MFDMLTNLTKAAVAAAITPIAVVQDIVTIPAAAYNDADIWTETEKRLNQISDNVDKALE